MHNLANSSMRSLEELTEEKVSQLLASGSVAGCAGIPKPIKPLSLEGSYRRAAVLVLLLKGEKGWEVLFTRRTDTVQDHKGQVSFPGGSFELEDENLQVTALRESFEEIGLDIQKVRILGELDPMLTRSSFLVTPVIATADGPLTFNLSPIEVGRIFTIPLNWLAAPGHYFERAFYRPDLGASEMLVFFERYDGEMVWGITARLVVNLLHVLGLTED